MTNNENKRNVPELRFAGFTDAWEKRKLGDLMEVTSVKRIHQQDWRSSGVRFWRARDIVALAKHEQIADPLFIEKALYENYSQSSGKVSSGDLLVTGVGSIGIPYLVRDESPLYFKDGNIIWFKNAAVDGDFLYFQFIGPKIQQFINASSGKGTVGTYTIDSGKKTPVSVPSPDEQVLIGKFLRTIDDTIALHQRKLDELKELKKAYLQKMFV